MDYPPFVYYETIDDYKVHYEKIYYCGPIITFDGIYVRFRKDQFDHCFFESTRRNGIKDKFSQERKKRIDWIKTALEDPDAGIFYGMEWKKEKIR